MDMTFRDIAERTVKEADRREAEERREALQKEFPRAQTWWRKQVMRAFGAQWASKICWLKDYPDGIILEGIFWGRLAIPGIFGWSWGLRACRVDAECCAPTVHVPWLSSGKVDAMSWEEAGRLLKQAAPLCITCKFRREFRG